MTPEHPMPSEPPRTDIYDEWFLDDWGTSWLLKGDRVPTRNAARVFLAKHDGEPYIDYGCRLVCGRVEWREGEGWVWTTDPEGPYEAWEVYVR